jgi:putative transposase
MRFCNSIFATLLKPLDRRCFKAIVDRHQGDAYDKSFHSWDHLLALIFAQLSGLNSLRGVVAGWNANAHHHYHLGAAKLTRTTLADANARRPVGVFADSFAMLSTLADRKTRREGDQMLRLIDSSPIPLGKLCDFATWNGRIRGLKMHAVYDPLSDRPTRVEVTLATVNDSQIGRKTPIEAGATYVFDKGYCHYGWWTQIDAQGAWFVTRPKRNAKFRRVEQRRLDRVEGDGFRVLSDQEVAFDSKGDSTLAMPLRRIEIERQGAKPIVVLTNDMTRSAVEIAALYKARWQIELLFRWIKQHLELSRFLGNNQNAIQLQIIAAMIAYLLLRLAAHTHALKLPALRLAELVRSALFVRKSIANLHSPPPVNPSKRLPPCPNQPEFCYA